MNDDTINIQTRRQAIRDFFWNWSFFVGLGFGSILGIVLSIILGIATSSVLGDRIVSLVIGVLGGIIAYYVCKVYEKKKQKNKHPVQITLTDDYKRIYIEGEVDATQPNFNAAIKIFKCNLPENLP